MYIYLYIYIYITHMYITYFILYITFYTFRITYSTLHFTHYILHIADHILHNTDYILRIHYDTWLRVREKKGTHRQPTSNLPNPEPLHKGFRSLNPQTVKFWIWGLGFRVLGFGFAI